ncbi:helix-turn-helix transcriptional regulator [Frateuria sp.]|uniref:helix-turn-helix transcriptional regulator n=1 Tax=Frateuria sp. TaxID=2211372 RepID=UPI0039C87303
MTETNSTSTVVHDRVVSYPELKTAWGIRFSRVHLRRLWKNGQFPRPISLGGSGQGAVGWLASELAAHLASCAAARNGGAA